MRSERCSQRDCEVFFVFNGTAANSLALASLCQSYHSGDLRLLTSHIETDECGAPEFFSNGSKLLTAPRSTASSRPRPSAPSPRSAATSTFPSRGW